MKYIYFLGIILNSLFGYCQIYISPNGDNFNGNGTQNNPFASLDHAVNNLNGTNEIIIEEGVYNVTNSINLSSSQNNITISGCGNAILNGGLVLDNTTLPANDPTTNIFSSYPPSNPLNLANGVVSNIVVVDLALIGLTETDFGTMTNHGYGIDNGEFETPSVLWIDGEKMTLARFPNKNQTMSTSQMIMTPDWEAIRPKMHGQISYSEIKQKSAGSNGGIKYSVYSDLQSRVSSWSHHKNSVKDKIWVDGVFNSSWEWEYNQVETIDTNGDITLKYEPNTTNFNLTNGISDKTKISHFYFENVAEELDEEGEYFIDRDAMKLYFYAPNDYLNKQITLSTLNSDLIKITNAEGITIKNITIQSGKKNAYKITNSRNISIENNTIRYFNQWAAKIDGTNNTVTSCEIYGLGGGGIQLGIENGQDYSLNRENNKVENCEIYNFAWDQKSQIPGVSLHGCGNIASNNEIYNGTHFAVKLRHARLSKVLNNRIHDLPTYHHFDGGAVYLGLGRKFHNRANEINNNYLYDIPTNGIYLDNYTNGSYANNNVFYNVGNSTFDKNFAAIYNHGGGQNSYENNIAVDCSVIIKTGSHIVKNGNTQAYFNDWYDTYHSSGFQAIKNNYSNAVAETILAQTDTDWFMSALNNLPQDVDDFFKNYSTSDLDFNTIWNANKDNWDEQGYLHTIAQDNVNDPTQLQWRNYFLLRYCKSSINNNLGLYTDNDVFDADNNKSAIKNEGDNKVFWEYSPYKAVDNTKHSNHEASNNEKLNVSETNLTFSSLVSNNSLSGSSITFSSSSSNLQNDLNNTFSATVDLNLLNNLPVCVQQTCNFNLKTAEAKAVCSPYNASSLTYSITIPFENGGNNQDIVLSSNHGTLMLTNDYNSESTGNIKIIDIPLGQSPTLTGGTSCNSNSINYTFNIAPDCNYFIGSDSNKWQIDTNWSSGTVPFDTTHAIIPDLTYTNGKENCLLPNGNTDVGSLTIEANAEVNINKSSTLTIKENLFVDDNGLLLIRSNGGSVTPGHGNLIVLGESTGNVRYDLFVQDYTKTSLVSPPVAGQTFADFASINANLYANPVKTNQKLFGPYVDANYLAWHKETDGIEEILTGTGYRAAVKVGNDKLIHFIGNVNTNTVSLNFSSLNTDGWHLIGNPYTSGIDLKKFIDTNINDGNLEDLASAVYGWDADDSDITGSKWTIVTKNDQKIIPPGQGFFVKPSNNKTIVFKPSMQNIHNGGGFIERNTNNATQSFYVSLTAGSKKTATKVYLNNEATTGLDQGYDVTAKNDIENFGIYTVLANGDNSTPLAVQTIPLNTVYDIIIPLGVVSDEKEIEIEIKAEEINVNNDIEILIEDIQNKSWSNLKKETLKVSYTNSDLNEIRFKIHFSTKHLDNQNHTDPAIKIFKEGNFIKIEDLINRKLNIRILDNYGRLILDKKFNKNQEKLIKVDHLPSGIYFLNVNKENLNIIKKIIL